MLPNQSAPVEVASIDQMSALYGTVVAPVQLPPRSVEKYGRTVAMPCQLLPVWKRPRYPAAVARISVFSVRSVARRIRTFTARTSCLRASENAVAKNLMDSSLLESSVSVEGLPLTNLTVAYYYVEYGTVLAFLSRPNQNNCPEAIKALDEVAARYSDDPVLMGIVADSMGICTRLASGLPTSPPPEETLPVIIEPTPAP